MDLGMIAGQLGDFSKFVGAFVDIFQKFAEVIATFAKWGQDAAKADSEIIGNTKEIFATATPSESASAAPAPEAK